MINDLEKMTKNIDPTKEWISDVCVDIQKALVSQNQSMYKYFVKYANKDDRIEKKQFHDALADLRLTEIYDHDTLDNFYYYCDINKSGVLSLNELQKTIRQYCQKDIGEFIEDIIDSLAERLDDKKINFQEFEEEIQRLVNPKDKPKYIKASELDYLLNKELRIEISNIDKELMFYYFKDQSNPGFFNYDKFLDKLATRMDKYENPKPLAIVKHLSSIEVSEQDLGKVLRLLSVELESANFNLEDKVYKIDRNGILTENEFQNCIQGAKLNLNSSEVTVLVNKYYNTIDKMVYAKQLLEDLREYSGSGKNSGRNVGPVKSASISKVAKYIERKKKVNTVVDNMFMMDSDTSGSLVFDDIKSAFKNSDIQLSPSQVMDILVDIKIDSYKKYDYITLLISLFGNTSQIKRFQERIKKRSTKRVHRGQDEETKQPSRSTRQGRNAEREAERQRRSRVKDGKDNDVHEDRFGNNLGDKLKKRGSVSSNRSEKSNRSGTSLNRRDSKSRRSSNYSEKSDSGRFGRRRGSTSSRRSDKDIDVISSSSRRSEDRLKDKRNDPRLGRDTSLSVRRNDSAGRDNSRVTGGNSNSRSRGDPKSLTRDDRKPESPFDRRNERNSRPKASSPQDRGQPRKSNMKSRELESITRIVGTRIRNSKENYEEVFKRVSRDDPLKLINDAALFEALNEMRIDLSNGDKDRLTLEIDTQKVRDARRKFDYEGFLKKAGLPVGLDMNKARTDAVVRQKMSREELRRAEDTIEEIKKELKRQDLTLYQAVDIRPSDLDISWNVFRNDIEDNLKSYGIELISNKDKLANLKLFLCGPGMQHIEVDRLNKMFNIDVKRIGTKDDQDSDIHKSKDRLPIGLKNKFDSRNDRDDRHGGYHKYDRECKIDDNENLFREPETFRGDQSKPNQPLSASKKSQLAYSDEEEEDDKEAKEYGEKKLRLDDEGRMNMAAGDLLIDLKSKEIDFAKTFENRTGFLSEEEFMAILQRVEYVTTSADQLDYLRSAFRDDKERSKISLNKIKQRFNTIDPTYLNKKAVQSEADAKNRLNNLPEKIKENVTRIDDYFKRKGLDVKQVFKEMDRNKDGTISNEEFCRVLMRTYKIQNFSLDQLADVYNHLDINKDNSMTIGEFMYFIEGAKRSLEDRRRQLSKDVTDQMLFEVEKLFEAFDTKNNGYIVEEDLYKIFKSTGVYVDRNTCKAIIREHDTNGDGKLSKKEFELVMLEKMKTDLLEDEDSLQDLNSMFHNADINKDGYLSIDELDIMFKQSGVTISFDDIVSLMKEIDVDGDGRLDIDEFIALMTMDHSTFKSEKSGNTLMQMKRANKKPAYQFAKYFKVMPNHFVESFTTRQWKKKLNLPSSVFEPKINPETLIYKDLKNDLTPKSDKDHPLLSFQILLDIATGVPYPTKEQMGQDGDFKIMKREVRVSMFNGKSGQYIANSACVSAIYEEKNLDKWKFNSWGAVGPNPLIFTSKDEEVVKEDDVQLIFEFVLFCRMGTESKQISCGF